MDMSPWRSPYLVFVYMLSCAKHSHHPALQPSVASPGHAPLHHGHLDIYTLTLLDVLLTQHTSVQCTRSRDDLIQAAQDRDYYNL